MKRLVVVSSVVALSLATIPLSRAQSGGMKGMDMGKCKDTMGMDKGMEMKDMDMSKCMDMMGKDKKGKSAEKMSKGKPHKGVGTVEKVDPAAGTVTLAHGPIKSLNWPAMTMSFMVKDRALLEKVKPGAKLEFDFVESGKDYLITEIK
ncbi:MAG: copper-binding protein [Betaproteobacteria bacterium]|nr:copper-binding protein [Betaproteobacteria bacterium]